MARHLVRSLCFSALAAVLVLQACGKTSSPTSDLGSARIIPGRVPEVDSAAGREAFRGEPVSRSPTTAGAPPTGQYETQDPPPWLAELFRSPDPNVRIQGLDAWARRPGTSLDPVTYALVDSDESVRTRAQEVLEQQLARR